MIRHILFDLDNTLYSVRYGLEEEVTRRVRDYTLSWLALPREEGERLWKEGARRNGTTIEWLTYERGFKAFDEYEAYIHPEDEADSLLPDPKLRSFLEGLSCPCSILTNSPLFHVDRVLKKIELEGLFYRIFDISDNRLKGKPHASAFYRALDALGLEPEEVLFIDDIPRYVEGYLAIGGRGILLDEMENHSDYPNERIKSLWELKRILEQDGIFPGVHG